MSGGAGRTRKALTRGREGWTAKIHGIFPNVGGDLYDPRGFLVRKNFHVTAKEPEGDPSVFNAYFYVSVGSSGAKIKFKF